jgi:hypothetical protein
MPPHLKQRFLDLKGKTSQGATDSKYYWVYSAKKLGLVDSDGSIWVTNTPQADEGGDLPFGTAESGEKKTIEHSSRPVLLVAVEDRILVSDFLYTLMTHAQLVNMEKSERTGNRKSLPAGLPGIGCRHCCQSKRKGLCRLFPARRRTLPSKVNDLYDHVRRCTLCPREVKDHLFLLKELESAKDGRTAGEKELYDRVWARMGHEDTDCH